MSQIPPQLSPSIVNEHAAGLRALVRRLVLDDSRVEDVLQETWLTALRSPPRSQAAFGAWLRKVAVRLAGRSRRAEATRMRHEGGVEAGEDVLPPDGIVQREMARRQVVDAVLGLPEPYRSTVLYRFFENLESREIAERLDLPLETVRTRLKRGLARLRDKLDHEHDGDPSRWHKALLPLAVLPAAKAAGVAAGGVGAWTLAAWALGAVAAGGSAYGGYRWLQSRTTVGVERAAASAAVEFTPDQLEPVEGRQTELAVVDYDFMNRDFASAAEARLALAAEPRSVVEVSGKVIDGDGQPLANANVHLYVHSLRAFDRRGPGGGPRIHRVSQEITTGADGRFSFRGPIRQAAMLQVLVVGSDGQAPVAEVEHFTGHNSHVSMPTVRMLPGSRATGRVVDASGAPVAGAKVRYRSRGRSFSSAFACLDRGVPAVVTDADGRFELRGLPSRSFVLAVSAADYAPRQSKAFVAEFGKPIECGELRLEPGHRLRGRIVGADGQPLPGASISGQSHGERPSWRGRGASEVKRAVAGPDGRFDIGAFARGHVRVSIEHPGYQAYKHSVSVGESTEPLDVTLAPTLTVTVRAVAGATGEVLETFGVRAVPDQRGRRGSRGGPDQFKGRPPGGPSRGRRAGPDHHSKDRPPGGRGRSRRGGPDRRDPGRRPAGPAPTVENHGDHGARVTGLSARRYRFDVVAPGYSRVLSTAVELADDVVPEAIEVQLTRGVTLRGRLVARAASAAVAKPVGSALVELLLAESAERSSPPRSRKDSRWGKFSRFGRGPFGGRRNEPTVGFVEAADDGTFELPAVPAGSYRLRVVTTGYLEHEQDVELRSDDLELSVTLDPGARVAGRILDADPALWSLRLWRVDEDRGPGLFSRASTATVDPDTGLYSFAGLRPGSYRMLALPKGMDTAHTGWLAMELGRKPSALADLQLAAGDRRIFDVEVARFAPCRVVGTVHCNGRPAVGYSVRMKHAPHLRFPVGDQGQFDIPAVLAGECRLEVVRREWTRADRVLVAKTVEIPRSGRVEPRIAFELGTIVVDVDPAIAPQDAVVFIEDTTGKLRRRRGRLDQGRETFAELPPGRYRVELFASRSPSGQEALATHEVTVIPSVPTFARFQPKTEASRSEAPSQDRAEAPEKDL